MTFSNSPLSYVHITAPFLGDPTKTYTITIPDVPEINSFFYKDFHILPIYFKNIKCEVNTDKIVNNTFPLNDYLDNSFMVNDSLFKISYHDRPAINWETTIATYSKAFVKVFFVLQYRFSDLSKFESAPFPVCPLPGIPNYRLILHELEQAHSVLYPKDISVFFSGRITVRPARRSLGNAIKNHFPKSFIQFLEDGKALTSQEYINHMSRAKIAWCPRSVWSPPNSECNGVVGKEYEAMCLEVMVLRDPLGVIETEERKSGIHFVETKIRDKSDLVEKIKYYLEHEDERKEIARNGRLWWERNCSSRARAIYMIKKCLHAMGELENFK